MKQKLAAKKFLHKKNSFAIVISSSILAMSLTAGTCGTFAWFTYATRAYVNYDGITIGTGSLEVGFVPEIELTNYANYNLEKEVTDSGKTIYWSNTREITPQTLEYILLSLGYATTEMYPVSSGSYHFGDSDFSLYHAPTRTNDTIINPADKDTYYFLPLVFRVEDDVENPGEYIPDSNIYLSAADLQCDTRIHHSIRLFSSCGDTNHLINPTIKQDGSTNVGGVLDLNMDGYYDTFSLNDSSYETMYGEFKTEKYHKDTPESEDSPVPESDRTTFVAQHRAGTYAIDEIRSVPETADFEGISKFKNQITPIAKTNAETDNYAYMDLTIFLEGWDLSVIEAENGSSFKLSLGFEIGF